MEKIRFLWSEIKVPLPPGSYAYDATPLVMRVERMVCYALSHQCQKLAIIGAQE